MENKFIIVVVITLLLIALGQLMKVYDLASRSRGDRSEEKVTKGENIFNANLFLVFMVAYFAFIIWLIIKFGMNGGMFGIKAFGPREPCSPFLLQSYIGCHLSDFFLYSIIKLQTMLLSSSTDI